MDDGRVDVVEAGHGITDITEHLEDLPFRQARTESGGREETIRRKFCWLFKKIPVGIRRHFHSSHQLFLNFKEGINTVLMNELKC